MRKSPFAGDHAVLTKTADYALRAILVLARRPRGEALPADQLAELTGTPANYLGKTLYELVRAGLLRSTRGRAGGFALAVPSHSITIARIAAVFSEPVSSRRCLLGIGPCNTKRPCSAHDRWKQLTADTFAPMETTTVADLLADTESLPPARRGQDDDHARSGLAGSN